MVVSVTVNPDCWIATDHKPLPPMSHFGPNEIAAGTGDLKFWYLCFPSYESFLQTTILLLHHVTNPTYWDTVYTVLYCHTDSLELCVCAGTHTRTRVHTRTHTSNLRSHPTNKIGVVLLPKLCAMYKHAAVHIFMQTITRCWSAKNGYSTSYWRPGNQNFHHPWNTRRPS